MSGVNQVIVLGNLGQDPELRYTQSQEPVATMSIATSEEWTDKNGEKKENTEWHRVVVWGKQAENCAKYLAKGHKAFVQGRLQTRSWDDKDGIKRYTTEIVAQRVQFLGAPQGSGARPPHPGSQQNAPAGNGSGTPPPASGAPTGSEGVDDIPF